jgi:hypothetical protein
MLAWATRPAYDAIAMVISVNCWENLIIEQREVSHGGIGNKESH